jgi:quercetin dioxygenase-like cupin family protein
MVAVNLNQLELNEFVGIEDSSQHCRATFPLIGSHGSENLATVYFELEPGDQLGRHTDSAEELLFIIEGDVEVEVRGQKKVVSAPNIALVPTMVPHNLRNVGRSGAKVMGFFGGANNIVATFEQSMAPTNSNVVDTSLLE